MSEKEFPSCAYDVCAEFDCEETMALALIATRNDLERTRKALDVAVDALREIKALDDNGNYDIEDYDCQVARITQEALEQINETTKGGNDD